MDQLKPSPSLSTSVCLFSVCLSLVLCLSASLSLSVCLCLSFSLRLSVSVSVCLSLSLCLSVSLRLSVSVSLSPSLSLSQRTDRNSGLTTEKDSCQASLPPLPTIISTPPSVPTISPKQDLQRSGGSRKETSKRDGTLRINSRRLPRRHTVADRGGYLGRKANPMADET